jgi:hypothetical protein
MRIRATITLAAALLLPLTACSSSSDDAGAPASSSPAAEQKPSTTPTPADAAELTAAVQAYTAAYFKGDTDQAYDALSKRCQSKVTPEAYGAVVKKFAADYGPDHPATDVQADVSGELARVTYKVKGLPKLDQQAQPWAREGGAWKYDAC